MRYPSSANGLSDDLVRLVIDEHRARTLPRLERLWSYYRNPCEPSSPSRPARAARTHADGRQRLGQERGLPDRLVGPRDPAIDDRAHKRREVVIENDIAWRIQSMVDFMFGKPVQIVSTARDESTRRLIERVLDATWEASGGIALMQDMALLGHVYGHVDLLLRAEGAIAPSAPAGGQSGSQSAHTGEPRNGRLHDEHGESSPALHAARELRIEVIDPTRGIPILDPADYRRLTAYIVHFERELNEVERSPFPRLTWRSLVGGFSRTHPQSRRATSTLTEIITHDRWQTWDDDRLVSDQPNAGTPGTLPVVHIQNISEPFRYEGLGEVEPLIPLQDELNTRLSDRASRVTMQSFRMLLAKGLDNFSQTPVEPGSIWTTENMDATVEVFGGDADAPSEERHIQEIREALDKASGVPPLASGVVRARIGNLTSANALRITLMGLLSKTARKRVTYGRGIARMCGLILDALDQSGALKTDPRDRGVRLAWKDPLPEDIRDEVLAARGKAELGVPRDRVLADLGYAPNDPGVT